MPVNCGACGVLCSDEETQLKCSGSCASVFHLNCAKPKTRSAKKDWVCEVCKPEKYSAPSTTNKPETVSSISKEFFVNALEEFKKDMMKELKSNKNDNDELRRSLLVLTDGIDRNNEILKDLMTRLKLTQEENVKLQKENAELRSAVGSLEVRMRNLEQHSRRQNLEIDGIPETRNENLGKILEDVAAVIGVDMKLEKVVAAHRVPSFNKKRTPPIVVKFATYEERNAWISGYKTIRPLTANKINTSFNSSVKVF